MKCIILAAGYATRLYPLTECQPKPLLKVGAKSILDWLFADLETIQEITDYILVSNHKFKHMFDFWKKNHTMSAPITILDDGSNKNENRLGAVRDLRFAIQSMQIYEDILVLAGDNVLDFSLQGFCNYFQDRQASCVMRYLEEDKEKLCKTGVAQIDDNDRILNMEEKPKEPKSSWAVPPFYIYKKEDVKKLMTELKDTDAYMDAPGSLAVWLSKRADLYAYLMPGKRYDIGNLKSYELAGRKFNGILCGAERRLS